MTAEYRVHGAVAVITLNNPPVNGLDLATRTAAARGMRLALADAAVKAIVIAGAGKAFSGGADIKEFNTPAVLAEPNLQTLIATIDAATKPVVAAIHTVCMGGGLELALGCHYRVAMPGARIALPEVKLGLLPGAGGTQRLPRMLGLEMALNMIVSGTPMASDKLAGTALFDEVFAADADLLGSAIAFADKIADLLPLPRVRDRKVDYPDHEAFLQVSRNTVMAAAGPFPAPLACLEAVAASVTMTFEDGMKFEGERFLHLMKTTESKALRHAFFAERVAGKVPDVPVDTPVRAIKQAAVIGAGMVGSGIAMSFLDAGIPVRLLDIKQEALDQGLAAIRKHGEGTMEKGKLTREKFDQRMALLSGTLAYEDIADADIVVEAVFEEMGVKEAVFRRLDAVMKPGAILATSTSTLDVDRIAGFTKRPGDVIGMHFFSPANVMKLLEIVRGAQTGKDVLATVLALSKKLKKTGVVSGVCDGFIGNRMMERYSRQAGFLLEEGALPAQVDKAAEAFGWTMGPFRKGYPNDQVDPMIVRRPAEPGITRRQIGDQEIVERLVYALVNEAANLLEEGVALRASDIDIVFLTGYGFPLFRGGPMFYADTVGLPNVVAAIDKYAQGHHGEDWKPAPLLLRLASEGKRFNN